MSEIMTRLSSRDNLVALAAIQDMLPALGVPRDVLRARIVLVVAAVGVVVASFLTTYWLLLGLLPIVAIERWVLVPRDRGAWLRMLTGVLALDILAVNFAGWGDAYPAERDAAARLLGPRKGEWLDWFLPLRGGLSADDLRTLGPDSPASAPEASPAGGETARARQREQGSALPGELAGAFDFGDYRLGEKVQRYEPLVELSPAEYMIFRRFFRNERTYRAAPAEFRHRTWDMMLGTVNGHVYKVAGTLELEDRSEANRLVTEMLAYCAEHLGKATEAVGKRTTWDARDGNVVVEWSVIMRCTCVNVFVTSNAVRTFERK